MKIIHATLDIQVQQEKYHVQIDHRTIRISESRLGNNPVAEYNRTQHTTLWRIDHVCGAQGYGQDIRDSCYACDNGSWKEYDGNNIEHQQHSARTSNLEKVIRDLDKSFPINS